MIRLGRGVWKGHILRPSSRLCRPTTSLVRSAFIDIVGSGRLEGAMVWDLCSGSGAVGLEALSVGAERCVFIDRNPRATAFVRSFLRNHEAMDGNIVLTGDVRRLVPTLVSKPDIVFIDPPYADPDLYLWIARSDWSSILVENGMVFAECGDPELLQQGWQQRKYGDSYLKWKTAETE